MSSLFASSAFSSAFASRPSYLRAGLFIAGCVCSTALFAQADPNAAPADAANANGRNRRGQNGGGNNAAGGPGGRGNFNPEEIQQRMAAALREQFEVTDDAEWKLISDRITAVSELRRNTMAGGGGLRGGPGGTPGGGRGGRGANPEQEALRQAISDKLPEAEIKSRLERLRESRKANEEKLTKAQEELRAILSVRQEAVAVMAGLLP